jgi:hypothetical protein
LVGHALIRAQELWKLLPAGSELPPPVAQALRDLPPHLSTRLLHLLVSNVKASNKAQITLLIMGLITPATAEFIMPASTSADFAVKDKLLAKLMACNLTTLDLSAQMELQVSWFDCTRASEECTNRTRRPLHC